MTVSATAKKSEDWEIAVSLPDNLKVVDGDEDNKKLSARPEERDTFQSDDCWEINIKSPALLSIDRFQNMKR